MALKVLKNYLLCMIMAILISFSDVWCVKNVYERQILKKQVQVLNFKYVVKIYL